MTAAIFAWEAHSNNMRLYAEASAKFRKLFRIDAEEAITNLDRAFEAKLESFHRLYDVTKNVQGFDYFSWGDTSILIVLRNAIHHRNHSLFLSWNSMMYGNGGVATKAGAQYLLASYGGLTPETSKYFLPLNDFYLRLNDGLIKSPSTLKALWDTQLSFKGIAEQGIELGYGCENVYVDVMPIFISAMRRVVAWMSVNGFIANGFDGGVYIEHFSSLKELGLNSPIFTPLTINPNGALP